LLVSILVIPPPLEFVELATKVQLVIKGALTYTLYIPPPPSSAQFLMKMQ